MPSVSSSFRLRSGKRPWGLRTIMITSRKPKIPILRSAMPTPCSPSFPGMSAGSRMSGSLRSMKVSASAPITTPQTLPSPPRMIIDKTRIENENWNWFELIALLYAPRKAPAAPPNAAPRSEEHTSELQSPCNLVCRLLLDKKRQLGYDEGVALLPPTHPRDGPHLTTR